MCSDQCTVANVKGVAARILYAIHVIVCLWKVMGVVDKISEQENMVTDYFGEKEAKKLKYYLVGIIGFYLLLTAAECGVIVKRQYGDFKWFSPSILLYLIMVVPCIWVVEWQLYFERIDYQRNHSISTCNEDDFEEVHEEKRVLLGFPDDEAFTSQYGLTTRDWSLGLQQIMLFVLIVGRWLSPKGDISRDQLSQLLMVYFGTAADILEYVTEGLGNSVVMCDSKHIFIVLIVWSVSLLQFTLNPAATREKPKPGKKKCSCLCFDTEIWSIIVSTCVQDGPYFGTRLYFMIAHNSRNQSSIFFTCKNGLLILLQTYRVIIIILDSKKPSGQSPKSTTLRSSPTSRRRSGPSKVSVTGLRTSNLRMPRFIRNIINRYRLRRLRPSTSTSTSKTRGNTTGCLPGCNCFSQSSGSRRSGIFNPARRRRHSSKGVTQTSPSNKDRRATII